MSYSLSWSLDTAIWPWGTDLQSPWLAPVYQMESSRGGTSRTHPVVPSLTVLSVQPLSPLASSRLPASWQAPPNSSPFPQMGRQGHRSAMAGAAKRDSGSASDGLTVACIPPGPQLWISCHPVRLTANVCLSLEKNTSLTPPPLYKSCPRTLLARADLGYTQGFRGHL